MKKFITLLLVLTGMVCTASAGTTMYILGSNSELGDWKPNAAKTMSEASDGTYYYSFTASATADYYFCFSTGKGSSADDWTNFNNSSYRPQDGNYRLQFGRPYIVGDYSAKTLTPSTSNSLYVSLVKDTKYLIGFDPTTSRVAVTYDPTNIYMLGGADGWAANSGKAMTLSEDYVYTCDFPVSSTITTFAFSTKLGSSADDWAGISDYRFGAYKSSGNFVISSFPNTSINLEWGSDNNHSFSIATEGTYKFVLDYKLLKLSVYQTESVTTNASGLCTYVNTDPLEISGATAYYAVDNGNGSATATSIDNPVASTPMIIKGDASKTYYFAVVATGSDDPDDNAFKAGPVTGLASNPSAGVYNFILNGDTFKAANGKNVGEGKAYLQLSAAAPAGARVLIFDDEDVTGINTITTLNRENNAYFNIAGQRVAQPTKGLYIVNGKKVIIK